MHDCSSLYTDVFEDESIFDLVFLNIKYKKYVKNQNNTLFILLRYAILIFINPCNLQNMNKLIASNSIHGLPHSLFLLF